MNKTINLLPQKSAGYWKKRKIIFYLRLASFLFLTALFISSVSIFLINRYVSPDNLKLEENQVVSRVTSVNQKMIKYSYVQSRVGDIKSVIDKRPNIDKTIDQVSSLIPPGITIEAFTVNGNALSLNLSSSSLKTSETVLDTFTSMGENKKLFKSVVLDGLRLDSSGKHGLRINASLL